MAYRLDSFDEFRDSLKYFFFLFKRSFTPALEDGARAQWRSLQEGDAVVTEDGMNNPLVDLRLDPAFGQALCAALVDARGELPSLHTPRQERQLEFWARRSAELGTATDLDQLSEETSHYETIQGALAWYAASARASGHPLLGTPAEPLRVVILGASARYEYLRCGPEALTERLARAVEEAAPGSQAEITLCGRDVPPGLDKRSFASASGRVTARHFVGYLHDLREVDATGALCISLHGGMGLEHPELTESWPPTFKALRAAAPVWFAASSFNVPEHEAAEQVLRKAFLTQMAVDRSEVNECGSLVGPDEIGPFDGIQGKRNYCVLHARMLPERAKEGDEWDLFD